MPFLTLEDPNAKVKGSRDPLGTVPIWLSFARPIITNITSVTTSVRSFTVLLLGCYFARKLVEEGQVQSEEALNVVLRMEQAAAYTRHVGHKVEEDIRGIDRVKLFLNEKRGKVDIQADHRGFILSDQRVYGVWGMYAASARRSGLLAEDGVAVTAVTDRFIAANCIPALDGAFRPLMRMLAGGGTLDTRRQDPVFAGLVKVLSPVFTAAEVDFYGRYLRDGHLPADHISQSRTDTPRQARFAYLLESCGTLDTLVTRAEVIALEEAAREVDEALARCLSRILHLESFLAPAEALFDFLLTRGNRMPNEVAAEVRERWGDRVPNLNPSAFDDLLPQLAEASSSDIAEILRRCHAALRVGDYETAIRAVLEWNARIQERRKGAPWILLESTGRLEVRFRDMEQPMPSGEELPTLWRNSYLIHALKSITRQLRNGA